MPRYPGGVGFRSVVFRRGAGFDFIDIFVAEDIQECLVYITRIVFIIGDGLIYLFYGGGAALMGILCLLGGMVPVVIVILVLLLFYWIQNRANRD